MDTQNLNDFESDLLKIWDAGMKVTAYKNYQAAVQHRDDVFYAGEEEIDRLYRIYSNQKG